MYLGDLASQEDYSMCLTLYNALPFYSMILIILSFLMRHRAVKRICDVGIFLPLDYSLKTKQI